MSSVVQLVPRAADRPASSDQSELLLQAINQVVSLTQHLLAFERRVADLDADNTVLRARVGLIESARPAPRFGAPEGWISVRQAVSMFGAGSSTISRLVQREKIIAATYNGRTYVDPASLLRWIERK
jgi:helix-turn-helix protein